MGKISSDAQAWTETLPYGKVFLRKYMAFEFIKIYACVQAAAPGVIPHLLEYYSFVKPLSEENLLTRLRLLGYPENVYVAGLREISFGQTIIAVTEYGGPTLLPVASRLKANGQLQDLTKLMRTLGACLGTLHNAGLICGDSHSEQYVVDECLVVRRIDVHASRVRMDIVPGHPIFGGINESYFENRRLTVKGFESGVETELGYFKGLPAFLDKECFVNGEAMRECKEGYLATGGTIEGWESAAQRDS